MQLPIFFSILFLAFTSLVTTSPLIKRDEKCVLYDQGAKWSADVFVLTNYKTRDSYPRSYEGDTKVLNPENGIFEPYKHKVSVANEDGAVRILSTGGKVKWRQFRYDIDTNKGMFMYWCALNAPECTDFPGITVADVKSIMVRYRID